MLNNEVDNLIPANEKAKRAYNIIKSQKDKFGVFHKTLFHVHTPASHDFKLISTCKNFKELSIDSIYQLCINSNVFPDSIPLVFFENNERFSLYSDTKECLAYILYAHQIIKNDISIIVIADHNNIDGIDKLRFAVKEVMNNSFNKIYPEIILGIEISCADKIHVVGIFEDDDMIRIKMREWLNENLLNESEGSFLTSLQVMSDIKNIGGISYIAHINSSEMFGKKYLTGAYKKKLLNSNDFSIIGLSNLSAKEQIKGNIRHYSNREINFVLDNDAHSIEELGQNYFWLKCGKRNFISLKEAINDFEISISYKKSNINNKYIKGLYVETTIDNKGFLSDKNGKDSFVLTFSDALNCLIGGRGSGKSTVLDVLHYSLSQRCSESHKLDFLCKHGDLWLLYSMNNEEYLIHMSMPKKERKDDNILRRFGQNINDKYNYTYIFKSEDIAEFAQKQHLSIYKINFKNDVLMLEFINSKSILDNLFDTRYSVNELVNIASSEKISNFISELMFENNPLYKPSIFGHNRGLKTIVREIEKEMTNRLKEVEEVLDQFNISQNDIKIKYNQNARVKEVPIGEWLFRKYNKGEYYNSYNITFKNIEEYLLTLINKIGLIQIIKYSYEDKISYLNNIVPLENYLIPITYQLIDRGINEIKKKDENLILKRILDRLVCRENIPYIIDYLKEFLMTTESFSLEFDLNNKETSKTIGSLFRDIKLLSLGQKVVAMLTFILAFGDYSQDFRPLLIDQPEDNLDSQYIYKNLIKHLRETKTQRQIIIATHNSTIVTNAKAEQVIVMQSDNIHGWVENRGYLTENAIKKNILNYLEGGIESFKHKFSIYKKIIECAE